LRLPGVLTFDPNRYVRVHSRFQGEVRKVGMAEGKNRPLQFGDSVKVGQLLTTIWSKDIGEKKSELVDALTREHFDKIILKRLESVEDSVVTKRAINDAERNYQADKVAIAKAERTLRSWNLTQKEIDAVHQEADDFLNQRESIADDAHWAEWDVVAGQSGVIVTKNFNVGDIIETNFDLMAIADLDRLQVLANAIEEDLPILSQLEPGHRKWNLQFKSDLQETALAGSFDQISPMVDPNMHTSTVMGYLDNKKHQYAIGQFITALIEIPGDPNHIVIPVSSAIEDGVSTSVFVETNAELQEFTRRKIAVVRRGMTMLHVAIEPDKLQSERGALPLRPGEKILMNSVVELDAELNNLISTSPKE
jgi:cobalt-zinc-cadmium efflux system membrane fusion protein